MYSAIEIVKSVGKPNVDATKPPTAGPMMLAMEGIIEENKLTVLARIHVSLKRNCRRLKLGQKVAMPNP